MESCIECCICDKLLNNIYQENYCITKHAVCHNCLGKWIFKYQNETCPVCRGRIFLKSQQELREERYINAGFREYKKNYQGLGSLKYLFQKHGYNNEYYLILGDIRYLF